MSVVCVAGFGSSTVGSMAIALSGNWRGSARSGEPENVGSYLAVPAASGIVWLRNSRGLRQALSRARALGCALTRVM